MVLGTKDAWGEGMLKVLGIGISCWPWDSSSDFYAEAATSNMWLVLEPSHTWGISPVLVPDEKRFRFCFYLIFSYN